MIYLKFILSEAIGKRISQKLSSSVWDDVFMVVQQFGEQKYLLCLDRKGGLEVFDLVHHLRRELIIVFSQLTLYCDKVAHSFPRTLSGKLLMTSMMELYL